MWGIVYKILSVPHTTVIDMNNNNSNHNHITHIYLPYSNQALPRLFQAFFQIGGHRSLRIETCFVTYLMWMDECAAHICWEVRSACEVPSKPYAKSANQETVNTHNKGPLIRLKCRITVLYLNSVGSLGAQISLDWVFQLCQWRFCDCRNRSPISGWNMIMRSHGVHEWNAHLTVIWNWFERF